MTDRGNENAPSPVTFTLSKELFCKISVAPGFKPLTEPLTKKAGVLDPPLHELSSIPRKESLEEALILF